jgi:alpha-tubulin suppressor-like RCC1 family protein
VHLLQGVTATAVFEPSAALDPNTQYRLVVTEAVRDLQGDALEARLTTDFTTGTTTVRSVKAVTVLPDTAEVAIGSQVQLIATPLDTFGIAVTGRPVIWSSDNPAVATVSATGLATARSEGVARVRAEVDGASGVAVVFVAATLSPVDSVEVSPQSAKVLIHGFVQLTTVLRDAAGNILQFRPVTWASSAPAVATLSAGPGGTAVVTGISAGSTTITATSEGRRGTATITVGTVGPYARIIPGGIRTCALTTDGAAWCWGGDGGALGNGTLLSTLVPTAVAGGLKFSQIGGTAGLSRCALTPEGAAYCWGWNDAGQLGIGSATGPEDCAGFSCSTRPVPVTGGLRFAALAAVAPCALTRSGAAYCWGLNQRGSLGIGSITGPEDCRGNPCSTAPVAVTGGLTFTAITSGDAHVCALDAGGAAYCWGWNDLGQLGDGTTTDRSSPTPVAGGLRFVKLSAGYASTCGLTSDGTAYCWGFNESGQLGVGTDMGPESCLEQRPCSTVPVRVAGGLRWASISIEHFHACAVTPTGAAYCWGANHTGATGIGTTQHTTRPTAVAGGLTFTSVDAGREHSCGVTVAGVGYCWGENTYGQLGDGTTTRSYVPVRVAGQP